MRVVLLPGLGADAALFEPQRAALPDLQALPWLPHREGEGLAAYAERMATADLGPVDLLGGVSMGGMVAYEMARHLRPRAVVLIASCTTGAAIRGYARVLGRLGTQVPDALVPPPRPLWPCVAWGFGATSPQARALIDRFLAAASPDFIRWGLRALLAWRPVGPPPCPVFHVHGRRDRLIRPRSVRPDRWVAGAGHFVNVTHAAQVNDFLLSTVQGLSSHGPSPSIR